LGQAARYTFVNTAGSVIFSYATGAVGGYVGNLAGTYFYGENAGRYWGLAGGIIGGAVGYQTAPRVFNALDNIGVPKIDGYPIIDGRVNGKIPIEEYMEFRNSSLHNLEGESMTMGKYWAEGKSYISDANETTSTYFDLGDEYNTIMKKYGLTEAEMFDYFNRPAIDDAINAGKEIIFSHDPELYYKSALYNEWEYLQVKYGFSSYTPLEGGGWIAK